MYGATLLPIQGCLGLRSARGVRSLPRALFLGLLDAALRVAKRLQVVTQLRIVRRPQLVLQFPHPRGDVVGNADGNVTADEQGLARLRLPAAFCLPFPAEKKVAFVYSEGAQSRKWISTPQFYLNRSIR